MEQRKILVLATLFLAVGAFIGAAYQDSLQLPAPLVLTTTGFPTTGNPAATVEIAVFEDFRCHNCRAFNEKQVPQLEAQYVATGKARYTMVPLAFMRGSKPMANAALAVYHSTPDRFFPYAKELFLFPEGKKVTDTALLEIAQKVGGINLANLQKALETRKYYAELRENLEWAQGILGKDFRTPALYINGIPTPTASYDLIQMRIEHMLTIGKGP